MAKKKTFTPPHRITEIPRWLRNPNERDDQKIAKDLIAIAYWELIDQRAHAQALTEIKKLEGWNIRKKPENQTQDMKDLLAIMVDTFTDKLSSTIGHDVYASARALAEGSDKAFDTADGIEELMARVKPRIAMEIGESGLLPYLEYNSVEEYLLSKTKPWDGTGKPPGTHYETVFMITYLIPTLEANGFDRDLIFKVADNFYKARYAVRYLRDILKDVIQKTDEIRKQMKGADEEEQEQLEEALREAMQVDDRLHKTLEALVIEMGLRKSDGGLSEPEFKKKLAKIYNKGKDIPKVLGYVYHTKDGGVMMISADNLRVIKALQKMTDNLVDWHLGDPTDLAREVGMRLLKEGMVETDDI